MLILLSLTVSFSLGCQTEIPICSDNYCVVGEVFPRQELGDRSFDRLPTRISEEEIVNLLTVDTGENNFRPLTVTGKIDSNFDDLQWIYQEDDVIYLRKVTLEFESDHGRFGENRVIHVHLNKDTVLRDEFFQEHVTILSIGSIRLTEQIGIATYKGEILGAPTKQDAGSE